MQSCVLLPGAALVLWGCSGDSSSGAPDSGADATAVDATSPDVSTSDTGATTDTGTGAETASDDGPSGDTGTTDTGAADTGTSDTGPADASDGGCPATWLVAPSVDPSIAVPADGGAVLIHATGSGTQNYACTVAADGGAGWTFVGPLATLDDCSGAPFGSHFASDAGSAFPEWQATDGTYVVGHKLAAFTPDGGAQSVPWLLLKVVGQGGSGTLAQSAYVQRLNTAGGVAPGSAARSPSWCSGAGARRSSGLRSS